MKEDIEYIHHLTSDQKIHWFGYGEWIEEADEALFTYRNIECKIKRVVCPDGPPVNRHMYGGYFCGYIMIPADHPYHHKDYDDMDISVHGGLTFGEVHDGHWIGFDCSHSFDYVPSMEYLKKTDPDLIKIVNKHQSFLEKFNLQDSPINKRYYRNMDFCIRECMSMAEQLTCISKVGLS